MPKHPLPHRPLRARGRDLAQRVRRRTRDSNPANAVLGQALVTLSLLLGGFALCFYLPMVLQVTRSGPALLGLVAGLAILAWRLHETRAVARERPWQATRREPLRRRGLLRWLARREALTCAYCHDDLDAEPCACPACSASYHPDCADELGCCATLGCEGLGRSAPPRLRLLDPARSQSRAPLKGKTQAGANLQA